MQRAKGEQARGAAAPAIDEQALVAEAQRIYLRYAVELVEALGLCPWARDAREDGRVHMQVLTDSAPSAETLVDAIERFERVPRAEIGLLLCPRVHLSRTAFQQLTASARELDAERKGRDKTLTALADFHPAAEPDLRSAERLISFVRRSPDPTVQLVRRSALSAVRMSEDTGTRFIDSAALLAMQPDQLPSEPEPLSRRVARHNLRTIERLGVETVRAQMRAIERDRDESYARLGLPRAPWAGK